MKASLFRTLRPWIESFIRQIEQVPGEARLTSWGRSIEHNARVGGNPSSQHLLWLAADFVPIAPTTSAQLVAGARAVGLIAVDEGDHVHVQRYPSGIVAPFIEAARAAGLL